MSKFKDMKVLQIDDIWWRTAEHVEKAKLDLRDEIQYPLSNDQPVEQHDLIRNYEGVLSNLKAALYNVECLKDGLKESIDGIKSLMDKAAADDTVDRAHHLDWAEAEAEQLDNIVT